MIVPKMRPALSAYARTPVKLHHALKGLCAQSQTTALCVNVQQVIQVPPKLLVFGQCAPGMMSARQAVCARVGYAKTHARSAGRVLSAKKNVIYSYVSVPAVLLEIQD